MQLAIVVGHNAVRQGALRPDTSETEYVWNNRLALLMAALAEDYGITARVFRRVETGSYRRELEVVYAEADRWGADASIELHFNSFADASAGGTETLSSGTAASLRFAAAVQQEVVATLGLRDRGVKTVREGRGSGSLISGRAPAILVEPFFGTNPQGQAASDERHEQEALAHAYLRGAATAFDAFPRASLADSRTLQAAATQRRAQAAQAQAGLGAVLLTAATQAQDEIATLPTVGQLADWLPYLSAGLIVLVLIATVIQRIHTDRIEAARIDDHAKALR